MSATTSPETDALYWDELPLGRVARRTLPRVARVPRATSAAARPVTAATTTKEVSPEASQGLPDGYIRRNATPSNSGTSKNRPTSGNAPERACLAVSSSQLL